MWVFVVYWDYWEWKKSHSFIIFLLYCKLLPNLNSTSVDKLLWIFFFIIISFGYFTAIHIECPSHLILYKKSILNSYAFRSFIKHSWDDEKSFSNNPQRKSSWNIHHICAAIFWGFLTHHEKINESNITLEIKITS